MVIAALTMQSCIVHNQHCIHTNIEVKQLEVFEHAPNCSGAHMSCSVYHSHGPSCTTCIANVLPKN